MSGKEPVQVRGLVDVLLTIGRQHGTGVLTIQNEDGTVGITFKSGEIVAADLLNQSDAEGLGRILTEKGLVLQDELHELTGVRDHHLSPGKPSMREVGDASSTSWWTGIISSATSCWRSCAFDSSRSASKY